MKNIPKYISLEVSNMEVSAEVSMNDSSDNESDAKDDGVASNADLSKLALGDDVKMLGVCCFAGVLE